MAEETTPGASMGSRPKTRAPFIPGAHVTEQQETVSPVIEETISVSEGRKRNAAELEEDEMYLRYKNKRMRVLHEPDIPDTLANTKFRTFMMMTDEMGEAVWGDPRGAYFKNTIQHGLEGAMRPDSYIFITNRSNLEEITEDELWANRKAGVMIHTLCDRIDWLNEQLTRLTQRADKAETQAQELLLQKDKQIKAANESRAAEKIRAAKDAKYRDYFHHVRYRTMIQFTQNRGFLKKTPQSTNGDEASKLIGRLRATSAMLHGGDLRGDLVLADSEYIALHQGESPRQFYRSMFEAIYMMTFDLAKWLGKCSLALTALTIRNGVANAPAHLTVEMAGMYSEVEGWINLIDRYILATDSTLSDLFDRAGRVPQMGHPLVKDIYERTDVLYKRFLRELEKFMHNSRWNPLDKNTPKQKQLMQHWDFALPAKAAVNFFDQVEKMGHWDKIRNSDLWGPSAKYQLKYNAFYFKQQAKAKANG